MVASCFFCESMDSGAVITDMMCEFLTIIAVSCFFFWDTHKRLVETFIMISNPRPMNELNERMRLEKVQAKVQQSS